MAYVSTPRSWTTGELVTASFMNGIRDALNEAAPAILTTAGDMLYASSGTVRARLAAVAVGQVLTSQGVATPPAWGALALTALPRIYACEVYHSVDQAVASLGTVALAWDSEHLDPQTMHDPSTNNSRITFPVAGIAVVLATVIWDATNTGGHRIDLTWNAGSATSGSEGNTPTAGQRFTQHAFQIREVAAADYVQCNARNDGGDSDNVVGVAGVNNFYSKFAAFLIPGQA